MIPAKTRTRRKVEALGWILACCIAWYVLRPYDRLIRKSYVYPRFFYVGLLALVCDIGLFAYSSLLVSKAPHGFDLQKRHPQLVFASIGTALLAFVCLTIGMWPAYTIIGPLFLGLNFIAFVTAFEVLPKLS